MRDLIAASAITKRLRERMQGILRELVENAIRSPSSTRPMPGSSSSRPRWATPS